MTKLNMVLSKVSVLIASFALVVSCGDGASNENVALQDSATIVIKGTMEAELTAPPFVPAPVGDRPAKKLLVNMEILEEVGTMTDGVEYVYCTFGGSVPGSF